MHASALHCSLSRRGQREEEGSVWYVWTVEGVVAKAGPQTKYPPYAGHSIPFTSAVREFIVDVLYIWLRLSVCLARLRGERTRGSETSTPRKWPNRGVHCAVFAVAGCLCWHT